MRQSLFAVADLSVKFRDEWFDDNGEPGGGYVRALAKAKDIAFLLTMFIAIWVFVGVVVVHVVQDEQGEVGAGAVWWVLSVPTKRPEW